MSKKNIVIGIVGPTNSGKSTLLNNIIGEKLSIVTHKAQTTRSGLRGLKIIDDTQMVFIDTPGIFNAKTKFEKAMLENAFGILDDVDLVYLLIDCKKSLDSLDDIFVEKINKIKHKTFLLLNKIDLIHRSQLLEIVKKYNDFIKFKETFLISAISGDGVKNLLEISNKESSLGPWLYPEDQIADTSMSLIASEITREKVFLFVHEEVPYLSTVETDSWKSSKNNSVTVEQTIFVGRKNHLGIVLGKGGKMIKTIGIAARIDLEKILEQKVNLKINVKFKKNWADKEEHYENIGLSFSDKKEN
ncbi:GTPase Era [Hyphomicrobiales bacterium]|nr:GTPase Era [Hyphomicrobiales bacterium]